MMKVIHLHGIDGAYYDEGYSPTWYWFAIIILTMAGLCIFYINFIILMYWFVQLLCSY